MTFIGPPDLSDVVDSFSFPVVRRRYRPSVTNADGYKIPGAVSELEIIAHVTMPRGQEVQRLPQGIEPGDARIAYTTADLRVADPITGARGDEIEVFGERYEVSAIQPYRQGPAGAASYIAATCVRVRRDDPNPLPTEPTP